MLSNNRLLQIDTTPWQWQTFRQTKDSDPTLLRKFECYILEKIEQRMNKQIIVNVREVGALDYLLVTDEPTLTQYARLCKVADTLNMTHGEVQDALEEYDRLFELEAS